MLEDRIINAISIYYMIHYNKNTSPSDEFGTSGTDTDCPGCSHNDACRQVWGISRRGSLTPIGLSLASIMVFLFPIITAISAGALAGSYTTDAEYPILWQTVGGAAGFIVGVLLARLIMPLIRKRFDEHDS